LEAEPEAMSESSVDVVRYRDIESPDMDVLLELLAGYGLKVQVVALDSAIPGSYWGESEAGLIGSVLYVRPDTPAHSLLHEACHYICMDDARRARLHTDAGGDFSEEDAVCYLQILLADRIATLGRERMWRDMDTWGYTFRLGSARAWFEHDAQDAREWLIEHGVIDASGELTGKVATSVPDRPC